MVAYLTQIINDRHDEELPTSRELTVAIKKNPILKGQVMIDHMGSGDTHKPSTNT
jgi:hypothetical protein